MYYRTASTPDLLLRLNNRWTACCVSWTLYSNLPRALSHSTLLYFYSSVFNPVLPASTCTLSHTHIHTQQYLEIKAKLWCIQNRLLKSRRESSLCSDDQIFEGNMEHSIKSRKLQYFICNTEDNEANLCERVSAGKTCPSTANTE